MKKLYIFTVLCVLDVINLINAQTPLNLKVSFEEDTLNIISPWAFRLEVLNKSDSNILAYPLLVTGGYAVEFGEIYLEVRHESDKTWKRTNIIINRFGHAFSSGQSYVTIQPHGRIESPFLCLPPLESIKPGKMEVRASYMLYKNSKSGRAVSDSISLFIREYKDDDLLAFQYVNKLKRPDFLLYPLLSVSGIDSLCIRYAEYIILNFPQSDLAIYAHLHLTSWYASKASYAATTLKSKEKMLLYLRLSKNNGLTVLEKGDIRMQEKATESLKGLKRILSGFYYRNPPLDLEREFTFTFNH